MAINRFNVRVYALISNHAGELLIADEEYDDRRFTKFPGGGVEFGEGIYEALQRESMEELAQELTEVEHFYTTDVFQASAFRKTDQIISIYYTAKLSLPDELKLAKFPFDFTYGKPCFRWMSLDQLTDKELAFPLDRIVLNKLKGIQ